MRRSWLITRIACPIAGCAQRLPAAWENHGTALPTIDPSRVRTEVRP